METQQILEILAKLNSKMDANQAEMKAEREAYHEEMLAVLDAHHERMTACSGETEADTEKNEPDPRMMQSTKEHQEIPKGEDAVMLVGEPRKRCRVCNLAMECHQKMKERIQEEVGCSLQEGVPPCKSGMAKKETCREDSDPGKS
jgi:hypothetical protein